MDLGSFRSLKYQIRLWFQQCSGIASIFVNKNSKPGNASVYFLARVPQFCRLFDNKYDLMVIYLGYMDPQ